jgi:hypothetical protein
MYLSADETSALIVAISQRHSVCVGHDFFLFYLLWGKREIYITIWKELQSLHMAGKIQKIQRGSRNQKINFL